MSFLYTAYYCEENIWHLCQRREFSDLERHVVLITNDNRACPLWYQRAARKHHPVFWDYHVIMVASCIKKSEADFGCLAEDDARPFVWDLDTVLDCPMDVEAYVAATFQPHRVPQEFAPMFRVMTASDFVKSFSSDRSHMKDRNNRWLRPPPHWPVIFNGTHSNLLELLELGNKHPGEVLDLKDFVERFSRSGWLAD